MSDILNKTIVLVLNRYWQAINIRTPGDGFAAKLILWGGHKPQLQGIAHTRILPPLRCAGGAVLAARELPPGGR
jgi:hypothetical protein